MRNSRKSVLSVAVGMLFLFLSLIVHFTVSYDITGLAARASGVLEKKAGRASALAASAVNKDPEDFFVSCNEPFTREGIAMYLFSGDSMIAWNNAQLPFWGKASSFIGEQGMVSLPFGHYYFAASRRGDRTALALLRIKPKYELQNRYLSNDFARWLGLPAGVALSADSVGAAVLYRGIPQFFIRGTDEKYSSAGADNFCYGLFLFGLVLIMAGVLFWVRERSWKLALAGVFSLLVLRGLLLLARWPGFFYSSDFYNVRIFGNAGSFVNGYLGDILINGVLFLFLASALSFASSYFHARMRWVFRGGAMATVLLMVEVFNRVVASVVTNSTLNFNFLDFMNLSPGTLVALCALALMAIAVFMLLYPLAAHARSHRGGWLWFFSPLLLYALLIIFSGGYNHWVEAAWPGFAAVLVFGAGYSGRAGPVTSFAVYLLFISAASSASLSAYISSNETKNLEVLTQKLGERQDEVLENEFRESRRKIYGDLQVMNLLKILPASAEAVADLINGKYFGGYFKRYTVAFSLFDESCRPLLTPSDPVHLNEGYFEDQLRYNSDSVSEGLFFVTNYRRNARYIGVLPLGSHRLYVMLEPKQFEELGSFPDLLLDESQQKHERLTGFSYAVYRAGQNTSSFGALNYPPFLPDPTAFAKAEPGFVHWYFSSDDYTRIIISRPEKTWSYFFTFNSYMLLLFSIIGYFLFIVYSIVFTDTFSTSSLTRRIQAIIIVLLLLAMSAVGYTSARLVQTQFSSENSKELREKTEIIFTDLSRMFTPAQLFDPVNREAVNNRLNEYSRLFNTDVSLFNAAGLLYATSQPRLYNLGLSGRFADPVAVHRLSNNLSSAVTISERAGKLSYMSLYTALYSPGTDIPAGFINLPYFARQNDLVTELSGIVNGLVNVYVILFVISILAGLILAGYITRPLRLIQQQIARISLGRSNEKIDWQGSDELGRLISEYNQMLVKLEESAVRLAKSERESAWREMAKQVAHEIKNPLTPMKLNLQYLQHLMKSDPVDFREKFEKASAGIIEQIDSLANIANEFSNFAQLPVSQVQTINIVEIIRTSLLLFENRDNITVRNRIPEEEIMVKGDRDQCLRVFNNLLTNAVQALSGTEDPWIEIGRQRQDGKIVIVVRDNGCGIGEEMKPRIFTPNFTTKTTGSGLGLAMVKNIIEGFGGRIWFSSEKGLGTIFYLEFISVSSPVSG